MNTTAPLPKGRIIRTEADIADQLARLEALKAQRRTKLAPVFNALIATLSDRLTTGQIHDRFEPTEIDAIDHDQGRSDAAVAAAREAREWLLGVTDTAPTAKWEGALEE